MKEMMFTVFMFLLSSIVIADWFVVFSPKHNVEEL